MAPGRSRFAALLIGLTLCINGHDTALPQEGPLAAGELIDPKFLRVCADPRNLPFSNEKGEGFENRIAELLAAKLGKAVRYTWYPSSAGFVRNTLGSYRCDVIMGFPQGDDIAQVTNPYYTASYALVFKPGNGLDRVDSLSDPKLKDKRIGIVAGTPPTSLVLANGLMSHAKPYPLVIDTRVDSSAQAMIEDIEGGQIDIGILWGPMAGYYAMHSSPKLTVVPLTKETRASRMSFRIGMAVRHQDREFKRLLNKLIQDNQAEIDTILLSYGVPLLDGQNHPIAAAAPAGKK